MPYAEHILLEVSGKLPPRKIAPRSGSGFGLRLALELGLGGGNFLEPLLENVCQWLHVERLKSTFTF